MPEPVTQQNGRAPLGVTIVLFLFIFLIRGPDPAVEDPVSALGVGLLVAFVLVRIICVWRRTPPNLGADQEPARHVERSTEEPQLPSWVIYRIRGTPDEELLGSVSAYDSEAAIDKAIAFFKIPANQRTRLFAEENPKRGVRTT